jgi:hypothetical protein
MEIRNMNVYVLTTVIDSDLDTLTVGGISTDIDDVKAIAVYRANYLVTDEDKITELEWVPIKKDGSVLTAHTSDYFIKFMITRTTLTEK